METGLTIHIFCNSHKICKLIFKSFSKYDYNIKCFDVSSSDFNNDFSLETYEKPDCIVLDKEINCNIEQKIKEKFEGIKMICLPSLNDSEKLNSGNITYISEPFRLSELGEAFKEIYNEKNRTASSV